jgi:response regulator RpfG family c-di-GMP phosphodiesterase
MTADESYPSFLKPRSTDEQAAPSFLKPRDASGRAPEMALAPWIVVVADDEPDVHAVTDAALSRFGLEGRKLQLVHTYSGRETVEILRQMPDVALLLLDVVMEHDHAGLEVVQRIREELGNHRVRIVLRTGQPGAAPETEVISRYDINGYADKTELTKRKLETLLYSCLRSFRDIQTIETQVQMIDANRRGLERVIDASATIFKLSSFERFTAGVLDQLNALVSTAGAGGLYACIPGIAASERAGDFAVIAGTGPFAGYVGQGLADAVPPNVFRRIMRCVDTGANALGPEDYIGVFSSEHGSDKVIYISKWSESAINSHIIELFNRNIGIAFDNIDLRDAIEETQREIVYRLGGAVETRSKETAHHVKRVAQISRLLGLGAGMTAREAEVFCLASPMHDLGKIGIPDHILNKPSRLTPEEWAVMKTHPVVGYELLRDSSMEILKTGARISLEHHEKWDGTGYPYGKKGTEIGIHGRITAVVDVFDALRSKRCYKEAWTTETVLSHIRTSSGSHFDPDVVDLLFSALDDVTAIAEQYPD